MCGESRRGCLHDGLEDRLYRVPGIWTLWTCRRCGSAWLDPRPSPGAMARAYVRYQTHRVESGPPRLVRHGPFRAVKERQARAFLNRALGHALRPALPPWVAARTPGERRRRRLLDLVRHLPPPSAPGARLLDVGCGNGAFLLLAALLGYTAEGYEPDPGAVAAARARGATVHEGVFPPPGLPPGAYEAVTACHVIEHVHDPRAFLKICRDLLRPGGRLWLQTPNLAGEGHAFWGRDWRGLEPPRHLVLFTPEALRRLCLETGFVDPVFLPPPLEAEEMFRHSLAVRLGRGPEGPKPRLRGAARRRARKALRRALGDPLSGESVTLLARVPGG